MIEFPQWIIKLGRRLLALKPGRYQLLLTIDNEGCDCTIVSLGKVERLGH